MKKITVQEYTDFVKEFYTSEDCEMMSLAEAFVLRFTVYDRLQPFKDSELFYTKDLGKAVEIIFDKYVELENGK